MKNIQHKSYYIIPVMLFTLLWSTLSHAVGIDKRYDATLYESSVKVDSGKSENELISQAFGKVLIKVSGRSDIMNSADYAHILAQSKNAISQFRYDYKKIPADTENIAKDIIQKKEKWFWVQFDSNSVDNLLIEAKLPVWGNNRPVTLVWFSQEVRGQRVLSSQYEATEVYEALQKQSGQRGISLMFPFLDLQDQNSISANDVWGNFTDTILLASRRYQAQASVTIRLHQTKSGLWISQWNLLLLGQSQVWTSRDENKAHALSAGIDSLTDRLAQQFTPKLYTNAESLNNETDGILIQVNNVNDYPSFQELERYFNSLASIRSANLLKVEQDRVIYKINVLADENTLIQEIKLGELLNPIEHDIMANNFNENKDYKPVILDNLDSPSIADNEGDKSSVVAKLSDESIKQAPETAAVPKVEVLIADLEYWLVR